MSLRILILFWSSLLLLPLSAAAGLSPVEDLGKQLFFDTDLSTPPGQSCAACHGPDTGWTGPDSEINAAGAVMEGAVHTRFETENRLPQRTRDLIRFCTSAET